MSSGLLRAVRLLCPAGLACVALGALVHPPAALAADPSVTIKYEGTLTEKYVARVSDPADYEEELTLRWEETATDDARTDEPISQPHFTISGSIHLTSGHQPPNTSCTGTFSTRPGPYGNSPAGSIGGGLVTISAVLPNDGKYVQSSGIEHCAVAPNMGVGVGGIHISDPELIAAGAPTDSFRESLASYSRSFTVPTIVHREKAPNGIEESENTLSLSATLTASTNVQTGHQGFHPSGTPPKRGGSGSNKPLPLGKTIRKDKEQARRDLPEALKEAWAAHGFLFLPGLANKPLLDIADELGRQAGPLDGNDAVTRVLDDLRIYDDPPLADVRKLAQPAPVSAPALSECAQTEAAVLAYCLELRSAYAALLSADGQVAADDTALEQTVSRASAAARSRNASALSLQESHAAELATVLSRALAAKRQAAGPVRTLLLQAGGDWTLSRKQAATAIAWLVRRLARSGFRSSALRPLAGGALSPVRTDLLGFF